MLKNGAVYTYEVYKEKSFSKAAQKLYVSQPALSAAIQREEARWGCAFFDRSRAPVELTEAGRRYVEAVERMMREQKALEEYFDGFLSERRGTLNIGAPAFFCTYVLPALVKNFGEEHRDAKVNIIEAGVDDLANCLQSETIDVCIAVEEWPANAYKSAAIGEEEIVRAVPRAFPANRRLSERRIGADDLDGLRVAAEAPKVSIAEFADAPFLLLKKGNDMHERALEIFRRAHVHADVAENDVLCAAVSEFDVVDLNVQHCEFYPSFRIKIKVRPRVRKTGEFYGLTPELTKEGCVGSDSETWKFYAPRIDR